MMVVILLGLWMVLSWHCTVNRGDDLIDRGKFALGFSSVMVSFICLLNLHTSHPLLFQWLHVTGSMRRNMAQSFATGSWVLPNGAR